MKILIMGKEIKIKPCPFCGKDEGVESFNEDKGNIIRCMNCGAAGPWAEQLSDAVRYWNERKKAQVEKSIEKGNKREIDKWKGSCHYCGRASSIAGSIGDDGLCDFCRKKGRVAPW